VKDKASNLIIRVWKDKVTLFYWKELQKSTLVEEEAKLKKRGYSTWYRKHSLSRLLEHRFCNFLLGQPSLLLYTY
jgi:hypothetical protein